MLLPERLSHIFQLAVANCNYDSKLLSVTQVIYDTFFKKFSDKNFGVKIGRANSAIRPFPLPYRRLLSFATPFFSCRRVRGYRYCRVGF